MNLKSNILSYTAPLMLGFSASAQTELKDMMIDYELGPDSTYEFIINSYTPDRHHNATVEIYYYNPDNKDEDLSLYANDDDHDGVIVPEEIVGFRRFEKTSSESHFIEMVKNKDGSFTGPVTVTPTHELLKDNFPKSPEGAINLTANSLHDFAFRRKVLPNLRR